MAAKKKKVGRPTKFNKRTANSICKLIAKGKSLKAACEEKNMPHKDTVLRWLRVNEEFRSQYTRARNDQADHFADEIVEIADTETDWGKARVRIDARKWVAGKQRPKKYGDKVQLTGGDGEGPIEVKEQVKVVFVNPDGSK